MCVRLNSAEANRLGLSAGSAVTVKQGDNSIVLNLIIDESIPDESAWIPSALEGNDQLGTAFAVVTVEAVMPEVAEA